MNFNVEQDNYTQFVYVIPFSSNEALVELTRFGKEKINKNYAADVLNSFINRDFGKFEILADELGCIPMTTNINPPNESKGILNTGVSANLIKPSTGYGFKRMHQFAQLVSEQIELNKLDHFNKIGLDFKNRFKFYDKLLLLILLYWPSKGRLIFTRLFEKHSILSVFSFLDEKSSFFQELKIFASLPIIAFLKALYLYLKMENLLRYICVFLIVAMYLLLASYNLKFAEYFSYLPLTIGLFLIGIPHGALDHVILKNNTSRLLVFLLKYLLIVGLYYAFWQFFPSIALLVFVFYSSFHFGESELIESGEKLLSLIIHLKAFLLGLCILIFIIFSHLNESQEIVFNLIGLPKAAISDYNLSLLSLVLVIPVLSLTYILFQNALSKRNSFLGLLFVLIIGLKVPLIMAFGFYFIFQHSANAWRHLKIGLNMNSMQLYKRGRFYILGSLIIFFLIVIFGNQFSYFEGLISFFFIFISCISFPHFFLMHAFYKIKKITFN